MENLDQALADYTLEQYAPIAYRENLEKRFVGSKALELARKALLSGKGETVGPGEFTWSCAGDCSDARTVYEHEIATDFFSSVKIMGHARKAAAWVITVLNESDIAVDLEDCVVRHKPRALGIRLTIEVRCRQCENCLRQRRRSWAARAVNEVEAAQRTWFGTLTLRPDAHEHFANVARRACDQRLNAFEAMSDGERFSARHRAISPEITKWIKRVRKVSGANLRLICVAEAHISGLPHYHLLVHECDGVVKYGHLRLWQYGYSQFKLVSDKKQACYVCKYLSKSSLAKVRASIGYGKQTASLSPKPSGVKNIDYKSEASPGEPHGAPAKLGGNPAVEDQRAALALGRYDGGTE